MKLDIDKFNYQKISIGVLGLGYVGLPLAIEFAKKDVNTIGFDIDSNKIEMINSGKSYIPDVPESDLRLCVKDKKLTATLDFSKISECDVIIVCVPTPLNKQREPDVRYIESAAHSISKFLKPNHLVILESTTYPKTTEEVFVPILNTISGMQAGKDFFVAFSPERIDPGNSKFGVHNTPKIVGGMSDTCSILAKKVYEIVTPSVSIVSTPATAEMVKLLENTYRSVNIALVNEFALICKKLNLNVWEIIQAASTKPFGFMPFYPGPGVGGHCIPIDPLYLSWKMRTLGYETKFIDMADEINMSMPDHVVDMTMRALNEDKKALNGSSILILGVAYKKDIDDFRESPALEIIHKLQKMGAIINYNDPFVPELDVHGNRTEILQSVDLNADTLSKFDVVVVTTDHSFYQSVAPDILNHSKKIIDTRNIFGSIKQTSNIVTVL